MSGSHPARVRELRAHSPVRHPPGSGVGSDALDRARATRPPAPRSPAGTRSAKAPHPLVALQRHAGNKAVATLLQRKCACGSVGGRCACEEPGRLPVQRDAAPGVADADDLTGTPFAAFDPGLKKVLPRLIDKAGKPTLAEVLQAMHNDVIASIARVGAYIATNDPTLFDYIAKIKGASLKDNYGIGIAWTDIGSAKNYLLHSSPLRWCQDDPPSALWYHGTTDSYRQMPRTPGAMSMHATFDTNTGDIHIDLHQPVDGLFPLTNYCWYSPTALLDHAGDVFGGGAQALPIGRYASARHRVETLRPVVAGSAARQAKLDQAGAELDTIGGKVTVYAAQGDQVGQAFAGDKAMAEDADTMGHLQTAEDLLTGLEDAPGQAAVDAETKMDAGRPPSTRGF